MSHCRPPVITFEHAFDFLLKGVIEESINDRIGDVVAEVHVEHNHVRRNDFCSHQPRRQKGQNEHQRDDEQNTGCFDVSQPMFLSH